LLSSHNGGGAVKILGTSMRWFCTNALRAAELDAAGRGAAFSFRHTSKLTQRLELAHTAISRALLEHDRTEAAIGELLARKVTARSSMQFLERFAAAYVNVKTDPHKAPEPGSGLTQHENAIERVRGSLVRVLESPTCEGIRGSAYGPFAATVEYLDNVRPALSADSRFDRTMVNTERGKILAFGLARTLL
jgi:hypothetical protein